MLAGGSLTVPAELIRR